MITFLFVIVAVVVVAVVVVVVVVVVEPIFFSHEMVPLISILVCIMNPALFNLYPNNLYDKHI